MDKKIAFLLLLHHRSYQIILEILQHHRLHQL
jgi:hypothetical protein